jgi:DMSO reductase family type II enzyme heme b subunit
VGDDSKKVKDGETVIKTRAVDGDLPETVDDPIWSGTEVINLTLVPQIIAKKRFFTPTNDTISVRALYNDKEIAFLLEWDDRTESIPGDEKAQELVDGELSEDVVAIQLPAKKLDGMEMPYFGHGDSANPVNIWLWKSGTRDGTTQTFNVIDATGLKGKELRDSKEVLKGDSKYNDGTWRVLIKRPLTTGEEKDIQFEVGKFTPISFANWDGSNGEIGSKHTLSTWYWVLLEQPVGMGVYVIPLISVFIIVGLQFYLARKCRKDFTG